jgi:hypothetical protein
MSLYELAADFVRLENEVEAVEEQSEAQELESLITRLRTLEMEGDAKAAGVVAWIINLEAEEEMLRAEAGKLSVRAAARGNKAEALRLYLRDWLINTSKRKFTTDLATVSLLAGRERVTIDTAKCLNWPPEVYERAEEVGAVVETREVKSTLLKKAFPETWQGLPGVLVTVGAESLSIRR